MSKLDRVGKICGHILTIAYLPLSLYSFLLYMASEATISANNPLYICLINVFCVFTLIIPFLCFAGVVVSAILRNRGCSAASFVIQFVPLIIFVLNQLLLAFAQTLPPKI